ncbi:hypothetical protein SPRG_13921 [Saprolegnia parasitica CBS 223.65]|uniref:Uncharacterized protein n=1 Tax=Saprolegnia parasitica (strain CBS 223.65) TaxID=695850 RepID=A0A067BV72_SAPPC|nr:hypothetical protein SPRG_13921 [Saprolegnia parasitica CBS 223.65]KDO20710.1 hypothetical protein SPRG_13921 [Saprolegnia parasitica CBS 223.65]|eukprot:XP_012208591.1 hypothetical protein SPRG_13921 [Saprolegnia parasitica CBS 223.65]
MEPSPTRRTSAVDALGGRILSANEVLRRKVVLPAQRFLPPGRRATHRPDEEATRDQAPPSDGDAAQLTTTLGALFFLKDEPTAMDDLTFDWSPFANSFTLLARPA